MAGTYQGGALEKKTFRPPQKDQTIPEKHVKHSSLLWPERRR